MRKFLVISILLVSIAGAAFYVWQEKSSRAGMIFKYKDESGQTHYVDSLDRVPEKFRTQAEEHRLPNIGKGDYQPYLDSINAGSDKHKRR
jgi:hypothetical protein